MGRDPHIFSRPAKSSLLVYTMPRVVVFLILAGTATTFLAYKQQSQVKPLSDDDRALYDDL